MQIKRAVLITLLFSSVGLAAITPSQVTQAKQSTNQMMDTLADLRAFILQVQPLIQSGNVYQPDFSSNQVSLTAAQIQDIVNRYNQLKAQLQSEFQGLP